MHTASVLSLRQMELFQNVLLLAQATIVIYDPKGVRARRCMTQAHGTLEAMLDYGGGRNAVRPWFIIPELGGNGLPVRRWFRLEQKQLVLIGRLP